MRSDFGEDVLGRNSTLRAKAELGHNEALPVFSADLIP